MRDHLHYNKPQMGKVPAKPIELLNVLIRCFCPKGGVMLDCFVGSGNTIIAAENNDINYIGFEISEDCFSLLRKRVYRNKQLSLF